MFLVLFLVITLEHLPEKWKGKNLLDPLLVSEKHNKAINANSPSSTRQQPILKCLNEVHIIGGILSLDSGIIELSVTIHNFKAIDKQLKSLS